MIGFLFLTQELLYGASLAAALPQTEVFKLPVSLGHVDSFQQGRIDKTLIFIQDAHDSLEAQRSIAGIIRHAVGKYGVRTVFEEGYEGPVPTDEVYQALTEPDTREAVSFYLLDHLRIGGAEYAHINRFNSVARRPSHVARNKESFLRVTSDERQATREAGQDFKLIGADSIKGHFENVRWFRRAVREKSPALQDLDLFISGFQRLADERFSAPAKTYLKLKQRFDDEEIPMLDYLKRARPFAPQGAVYPTLDFLLKAEQADRPALEKQIQSLSAQALFQEIQSLDQEISGTLFKGGDASIQKPLYSALKHLSRLKRLLDFKMTPAELNAVKNDLREFDTQAMARALVRETRRSAAFSKKWEASVRSAIQFYEAALKRETAAEQQLEVFLNHPDEKTAVLVYGGFHRQGIQELLSRKGVSYYIVSPRIRETDTPHRALYRKLMEKGYALNPAGTQNPPQAARLISELELARTGGPEALHQLGQFQKSLLKAASEVRAQARGRRDPPEYVSAMMDLRLEKKLRSEIRAARAERQPLKEVEIMGLGPDKKYVQVYKGKLFPPPAARLMWAKTYTKLKVKTHLDSAGDLRRINRGAMARFGVKHAGAKVEANLEWGSSEKMYSIVSVKLAGKTVPFRTVRLDSPAAELIGSFYSNSPVHRGKAWSEKHPRIVVKTQFDSHGIVSVLGQSSLLKFGEAFAGKSALIHMEWSKAAQKYVVLWARVGRNRYDFKVVRKDTPSAELIASFYDKSPRDRGRAWSVEHPHITVETELDTSGALSLFSQSLLAHFGKNLAGAKTKMHLAWSQESGRYVALWADINGQRYDFKVIRTDAPDHKLIASFYALSPEHLGRAWSEKHPRISAETKLDGNGVLSLLGNPSIAAFGSGKAYEKITVHMQWEPVTKTYMTLWVELSGERIDFKTVRKDNGQGPLIDTFYSSSPAHRGSAWAEKNPRIFIQTKLTNEAALGLLGENIIAHLGGKSNAGKSADSFLEWSALSHAYMVRRVEVHAAKDVVKEYPFVLIWRKGGLRESFYGGHMIWSRLFNRVDVTAGDTVWVPLKPSGEFYYERQTQKLYKFQPQGPDKTVYAVYDWQPGIPNLRGVYLDGRLVPLADLAANAAKMKSGQNNLLEGLIQRAREKWRNEDLFQAAVLSAVEKIANGETREEALWDGMNAAARKSFYELEQHRPASLDEMRDSFRFEPAEENLRDRDRPRKKRRSEVRDTAAARTAQRTQFYKLLPEYITTQTSRNQKANDLRKVFIKADAPLVREFEKLLSDLLNNARESAALRQIGSMLYKTDAGQRGRVRALYERFFDARKRRRKEIPILKTDEEKPAAKPDVKASAVVHDEILVKRGQRSERLRVERITGRLAAEDEAQIKKIYLPYNTQTFLEEMTRSGFVWDNYILHVIRNNRKQIIAYAWSHLDRAGGVLGLAAVGVAPRYRKQGLAAQLRIRQMQIGLEKGMRSVRTHVGPDGRYNQWHWSLHKLGFEIKELRHSGMDSMFDGSANTALRQALTSTNGQNRTKQKSALAKVLRDFQEASIVMGMPLTYGTLGFFKQGVEKRAQRRSEVRSAPLTIEEQARLKPVFSSAEAFFSQIKAWEKNNPGSKILTLVRHGESMSNLFHYSQSYDSFSPLTWRGQRQARALAAFFKRLGITFDGYVASSLERAFDTLAPTAGQSGSRTKRLQRFREILLNPIGEIPMDILNEIDPDLWNRFTQNPELLYLPGGQYSGQKFKEYLLQFIQDDVVAKPGRRTVVSSHGMTILLALMYLLDIPRGKYNAFWPPLGNPPHAGITVLAYHPERAQPWEFLVKSDDSYMPENLRGRTTHGAMLLLERGHFYFLAALRGVIKFFVRASDFPDDFFSRWRTFFVMTKSQAVKTITDYWQQSARAVGIFDLDWRVDDEARKIDASLYPEVQVLYEVRPGEMLEAGRAAAGPVYGLGREVRKKIRELENLQAKDSAPWLVFSVTHQDGIVRVQKKDSLSRSEVRSNQTGARQRETLFYGGLLSHAGLLASPNDQRAIRQGQEEILMFAQTDSRVKGLLKRLAQEFEYDEWFLDERMTEREAEVWSKNFGLSVRTFRDDSFEYDLKGNVIVIRPYPNFMIHTRDSAMRKPYLEHELLHAMHNVAEPELLQQNRLVSQTAKARFGSLAEAETAFTILYEAVVKDNLLHAWALKEGYADIVRDILWVRSVNPEGIPETVSRNLETASYGTETWRRKAEMVRRLYRSLSAYELAGLQPPEETGILAVAKTFFNETDFGSFTDTREKLLQYLERMQAGRDADFSQFVKLFSWLEIPGFEAGHRSEVRDASTRRPARLSLPPARSEVRAISNYQLKEAFGAEMIGPELTGGRDLQAYELRRNGVRIAERLPDARYVFRVLNKDEQPVRNRVIKITQDSSQNEELFREAQILFELQQEPAVPGVPRLVGAGEMDRGRLWIEQEGINADRTLESEIFVLVSKIFNVLIDAGESVRKVHSRGVIHGNIRPAAFQIEDAAGQLELIDFRNARAKHADRVSTDVLTSYSARDPFGNFIKRDLTEDVDVYSFVLMTAELFEQQMLSRTGQLQEVFRRLRDEYLQLIFEQWGSASVQNMLTDWNPDQVMIRPRSERPQSMLTVLEKLKSDLEIVGTGERDASAILADLDVRAEMPNDNLFAHWLPQLAELLQTEFKSAGEEDQAYQELFDDIVRHMPAAQAAVQNLLEPRKLKSQQGVTEETVYKGLPLLQFAKPDAEIILRSLALYLLDRGSPRLISAAEETRLNKVLELYNRHPKTGWVLDIPSLFNLALKVYFDYPEEFKKLSSRLKHLPGELGVRAAALSLFLHGVHLNEVSSDRDDDFWIFERNLKFLKHQLRNPDLSEQTRGMAELGILRISIFLVPFLKSYSPQSPHLTQPVIRSLDPDVLSALREFVFRNKVMLDELYKKYYGWNWEESHGDAALAGFSIVLFMNGSFGVDKFVHVETGRKIETPLAVMLLDRSRGSFDSEHPEILKALSRALVPEYYGPFYSSSRGRQRIHDFRLSLLDVNEDWHTPQAKSEVRGGLTRRPTRQSLPPARAEVQDASTRRPTRQSLPPARAEVRVVSDPTGEGLLHLPEDRLTPQDVSLILTHLSPASYFGEGGQSPYDINLAVKPSAERLITSGIVEPHRIYEYVFPGHDSYLAADLSRRTLLQNPALSRDKMYQIGSLDGRVFALAGGGFAHHNVTDQAKTYQSCLFYAFANLAQYAADPAQKQDLPYEIHLPADVIYSLRSEFWGGDDGWNVRSHPTSGDVLRTGFLYTFAPLLPRLGLNYAVLGVREGLVQQLGTSAEFPPRLLTYLWDSSDEMTAYFAKRIVRSEVRAVKTAGSSSAKPPVKTALRKTPVIRMTHRLEKIERFATPAGVFLNADELADIPETETAEQMQELMALLSRHKKFDLYVEGNPEKVQNQRFHELLEQYRDHIHLGPLESTATLQQKKILIRVSFIENHGTPFETEQRLQKIKTDYGLTQDLVPLEYTRGGAVKGLLNLAESLKAELIRKLPARFAVRTASGYLRLEESFLASIWKDLQTSYVFQWSA